MKTETLLELQEKTMKVVNLRSYLEDYDENIGTSKQSIEKSLFLAEVDLENFLSDLTPKSNDYIDSMVFTCQTRDDLISVTEGTSEYYLGGVELGKNYRVSLEEI